jgi:hypothetical protein
MPLIYHSALALKDEHIALLKGKKFNILRSFYPKPNENRPAWVNKMFLDSGAFSARNSNKEISVKEYGKYLLKKGHLWDEIAGLDVIGDPIASEKNQQYLDSLGLETIPTFHPSSDIKYLEKLLNNYSHIALGGVAMLRGKSQLRSWLDRCWEVIGDWPGKVHGFAVTDFNLIKRYPWYSVDSTTAARAGRIGILITPWGQLDISVGLKKYVHEYITTPGKIEVLMNWIRAEYSSYFPDLTLEDINASTTQASNLRVLLNILYMEKFKDGKAIKKNYRKRLF